MGNIIRQRSGKNSIINERKLLRRVWAGIGDNPQYHGNVFFLQFCKTHPQYTKYFTLDPEMPLTIDAHITTHFSTIMETMGYLLVDYYNNRKQQDYFLEYIAMVHKDMRLFRRDMHNFGVSLIEYLIVTFPTIMTLECQKIVSRYIFNLTENISKNLEDMRKRGSLNHIESTHRSNSPFVRWIFCQDDLVYGKTVDFWTEWKRIWEARLAEWKRRTHVINESHKNSLSVDNHDDDDDDVIFSEEFNDNDTLHSVLLSNTNSSSTMSMQLSSLENMEISLNEPNIILRTKKSGETDYNAVEIVNHANERLVNTLDFDFSFQDDTSSASTNYEDISDTSLTIRNTTVDSIARQRRRKRYAV